MPEAESHPLFVSVGQVSSNPGGLKPKAPPDSVCHVVPVHTSHGPTQTQAVEKYAAPLTGRSGHPSLQGSFGQGGPDHCGHLCSLSTSGVDEDGKVTSAAARSLGTRRFEGLVTAGYVRKRSKLLGSRSPG